jgi:hypothetical protein
MARAEAKAAALIDASCSAVGANPACYVNDGFDTGAAWVGFMGSAIDGQVLNASGGLEPPSDRRASSGRACSADAGR